MALRAPLAVLTLLLAGAATAPAAQAAACGGSTPHGITDVVATNISCASALKVAQNYNYAKMGQRMNGWACKGARVSASREKVTCRKGARKVTFRSTYTVELPAAPVQSSTNAGS